MLKVEREAHILASLKEKPVLKINEVAQELATSPSTIRRDFDNLYEMGKVERVHGGISALRDDPVAELPNEEQVKQKLCALVAKEIPDNSCIFVDGGTTFRYLLPFLNDKHIRIVTNNELIAGTEKNGYAEIILLGGNYDDRFYVTTGLITLNTLDQFNFDISLIGCEGYSPEEDSLFAADVNIAAPKQKAMACSTKNYLVMTEKKTSIRGFYRFAALREFSQIFVDNNKTMKDLHPHVKSFDDLFHTN